MARIAETAESALPDGEHDITPEPSGQDVQVAMTAAASRLADELDLAAIVSVTQTGATALAVARASAARRRSSPRRPSRRSPGSFGWCGACTSIIVPLAESGDEVLDAVCGAVVDAGNVPARATSSRSRRAARAAFPAPPTPSSSAGCSRIRLGGPLEGRPRTAGLRHHHLSEHSAQGTRRSRGLQRRRDRRQRPAAAIRRRARARPRPLPRTHIAPSRQVTPTAASSLSARSGTPRPRARKAARPPRKSDRPALAAEDAAVVASARRRASPCSRCSCSPTIPSRACSTTPCASAPSCRPSSPRSRRATSGSPPTSPPLETTEGVEAEARTQLGMVKKGESLGIVIDGDEKPATNAAPRIDSDRSRRRRSGRGRRSSMPSSASSDRGRRHGTASPRSSLGRSGVLPAPRGASPPPARYGFPTVIASPSRLDDGTPFPTTYWLTCPYLADAASAAESAGRLAEWDARVAGRP